MSILLNQIYDKLFTVEYYNLLLVKKICAREAAAAWWFGVSLWSWRSWFDPQTMLFAVVCCCLLLFPWARNFTHIVPVNPAVYNGEFKATPLVVFLWARSFIHIVPALLDNNRKAMIVYSKCHLMWQLFYHEYQWYMWPSLRKPSFLAHLVFQEYHFETLKPLQFSCAVF